MKIICAWCGKYMGVKPPYHDKSITHTICDDCYKKETEPYAKIDITRPDTKNAGACNNDETVERLADRASIKSTEERRKK